MADVAPLNLRTLWISTLSVFRGHAPELLLLALLQGGGAVAAQFLYRSMATGIAATPALAVAPWAVGFAPFVLADAAIVVVGLVALGGGKGRLGFALLAALGMMPAAVVIDLVENAPDLLAQVFPVLNLETRPDLWALAPIFVGIVWNVLWMPALAVAGEEHAGPLASLIRSVRLMKGEWWRVLSFTLPIHMLVLAPVVVVGIISAMTGMLFPAWVEPMAATPFFALGSVAQATIYWELARLKDGVAPRQMGAIFD